MSFLSQIRDGFGPKPPASDAIRRRIRAMEQGTLAMFVVGAASIYRGWQLDVDNMWAAVAATMLACAINLVVLRRTRRVRVCGNAAIGCLYSLIVFGISESGGFSDPMFAWLYAVPVAAAWLVDLRSGWGWTGVVLATTVGFWLLPSAGIEVPYVLPENLRAGQALFNRISEVIALAALATSFALNQRRSERELAASNLHLIREAMCVQLLQDATVAANEALNFDGALRACAERVLRTTGWDIAHAWLPATDGSGDFLPTSIWLTTEPERFRPLQMMTGEMRCSPGRGLVGRTLVTRRPEAVATSATSLEGLARSACALELGLCSAVMVPALSKGEVVGVLEFFSTGPSAPDPRLLDVLGDVGRQIGRVAERMSLHERLRQSQKLESVGQLAAGIAHEINNPMAYVRANLSMLRGEWASLSADVSKAGLDDPVLERVAECEELIDESIEGVDRTIAIVRDVKEFSHASETRRETADLNDLVESALRVATARVPEGIEVVRRYGSVAPISCFPSQLRQVFLNLVVNAFDAIGSEGIFRVETETVGAFVVARFEDDGSGIAPEHLERLFDPFFTMKPAGEGTGLGLFISYEIVQGHGGEIRVDSEVGRGTRFEVRIPVGALDSSSTSGSPA